jgi:hypothetical protein
MLPATGTEASSRTQIEAPAATRAGGHGAKYSTGQGIVASSRFTSCASTVFSTIEGLRLEAALLVDAEKPRLCRSGYQV